MSEIFYREGVEFDLLANHCDVLRGKRLTRRELVEGGEFPVFHGGTSPMGYYDNYNRKENTTIVVNTGNAGYVSFSDKKFWSSDACFALYPHDELLDKFLYYAVKNQEYILYSKIRVAAMPTIDADAVKNLIIPLPPLEVQRKIVEILDKFTELTRELELRKKQYIYYRDKLLTNPKGAKNFRLGDIATITRGGNFQKKDFTENGRPCIHYGQIHTYYGAYAHETLSRVSDEIYNKSRKAQPGDIVMATTSEDVKGVCKCTAWLGDEPAAVSGHTAIIHHEQDAKFLSYFFQSDIFYEQKRKLAYGVKVIEVRPVTLNDVIIPLPPLDEQIRISSILDKFDSLCNDITSGIPAEISARRKQYEYYRDKLLTFKQKS